MIQISLEEFIKTYKPVVVNEEISLDNIEAYLQPIINLHQIRLNKTYSMYFWTQIDNSYLLNGKIYENATGFIICQEPHYVDEPIKVII